MTILRQSTNMLIYFLNLFNQLLTNPFMVLDFLFLTHFLLNLDNDMRMQHIKLGSSLLYTLYQRVTNQLLGRLLPLTTGNRATSRKDFAHILGIKSIGKQTQYLYHFRCIFVFMVDHVERYPDCSRHHLVKTLTRIVLFCYVAVHLLTYVWLQQHLI